jgi:hypothetical protein
MTTAATQTTYYEVAWGIEEHESKTYVDNGDGSFLSEDAEARATRAWLDLIRRGVKAGFFINGVFECGHDFAEEWAAAEAEYAKFAAEVDRERAALNRVEHKTRTYLLGGNKEPRLNWSNMKWVYDRTAKAVCTCGWKVVRDNRDLARRAAREHREDMSRSTGEMRGAA